MDVKSAPTSATRFSHGDLASMSWFDRFGKEHPQPGTHVGEGAGWPKLLEATALVSVLAAATLIYRRALFGFFVGDDFGWLAFARFESLGDYASCFFRFNPWGAYRPLSQETFFWLGQKTFGLWPPGFHILSIGAHLTASALVYLLLRRFFDPLRSLVGTLIYAIHGAHLVSIYWISAFPEPLAGVFSLAALLGFIRFSRNGDRRAYFFSLAAMGLGILSKESVLVLPMVLAAYCLLFARSRLPSTIPHFSISGLYALLRARSQAVAMAPYELTLGSETWENLLAYLSWMGGLGQSVVSAGLRWDPAGAYRLGAAAFAGLVLLAWLMSQHRRVAFFAILWMALALQPFLYFLRHNHAYYLAPALAAFSLLVASALPRMRNRRDLRAWFPALGVVCLFLSSSLATVRLEGRWWNERESSRRDLVGKMLAIDREVPAGRTAYIFGLRSDQFESLENGAIYKAYGLSAGKFRFVLPGLDPDLPSRLQRLKEDGSLDDAYCFVLSDAGVINETEAFRNSPDRFSVSEPARFLEVPGVRIEASPEVVRSGEDTLTVRVVNFDVPAIDVLYSLDGQLMPPLIHWLLNAERLATVFVDAATPKGHYQFKAIRDSRNPGDDQWIKVNAAVTVR